MALYPGALQLLLPESHTQPTIVARAVILHSAAGRGSLHNFFLNGSNLESHFWVSESGRVEQYIDTGIRADANLKANSFAVSIETESSVQATEPWTDAQVAALVKLVGWICDTHAIPKVQIPTWNGSGIGWHNMFGTPGPWTPHAKTCPGPARTQQARTVIIPAVTAGGTKPAPAPAEKPATPAQESLMVTADDEAKIRKIVADELASLKVGLVKTFNDMAAANKAEETRDGSLRGWILATAKKNGVTRDDAIANDPTHAKGK